MKLLILSDLHIEFGVPHTVPAGVDYDVVVLAGDIHSPGRKAVQWARRPSTFAGKPVVMVAGNHEFYGGELTSELAAMRATAVDSPVHVLDRSSVVIGGVRFLGAMLWTDFRLPVRQADGSMRSDTARAMATADMQLNDFRQIRVPQGWQPGDGPTVDPATRRLLRVEDTVVLHELDRAWLLQELAEPFDGPTIVVTHHAPAAGSVAERYASSWLTPAFVSDLPREMFSSAGKPVALWVHGHTRTSFDYQVHGCRVVSNPRGYRLRKSANENAAFQARLVVDV